MAPLQTSGIKGTTPRAQRFTIAMPIRCRCATEMNWFTGQVENISRSGLLFRAEATLEVHAPVELQFELPNELGGEAAAQVICRGEIVRTVLPATSDESPALAARILDYRFVRGTDSPVA